MFMEQLFYYEAEKHNTWVTDSVPGVASAAGFAHPRADKPESAGAVPQLTETRPVEQQHRVYPVPGPPLKPELSVPA